MKQVVINPTFEFETEQSKSAFVRYLKDREFSYEEVGPLDKVQIVVYREFSFDEFQHIINIF